MFNGSGDAGSACPGLPGTIDVSWMVVLSQQNTPPKLIAEWRVRMRTIFSRG